MRESAKREVKNMKKTAKRFSLGLKIASMLTCLVVTAVGFASWLIITPAEATTEKGSFTVYEVETQGVTVSVTPGANTSIVFGKGTTTNEHPWLLAQDVDDQQLTATFTVEVSTGSGSTVNLSEVTSQIKVTFDIAEAFSASFDEAVTNGYLAAPTVTLTNGQTGSATYAVANGDEGGLASISFDAPEATSVSFDIQVTFAWGSVTGGENPYAYFNSLPANSSNVGAARAMLEAISNIVGDSGDADNAFTVTVETVIGE